MEPLHTVFYFLDITGTFAFAVSGATAARMKKLDLFGICAVAFTVACGGGIVRDLCLGVVPPTGLTVWYYMATALFAAILTMGFFSWVRQMNRPVIFFDSMGLAIFAVTGAEKTLALGYNAELAILLGMVTAVGGGVIRDILLNRIPVILEKEIYASAAFIAALIVVIGYYYPVLQMDIVAVIAIVFCFLIRTLALKYHWNLPVFKFKKGLKNN